MPVTHKVGDELAAYLEISFRAGQTCRSLQASLRKEGTPIAPSSLRRYKRTFDKHGTIYDPDPSSGGRPRSLSAEHEQALLSFLLRGPAKAELTHMQRFLQDEFGTAPSLSTISRSLRRRRWSRKTLLRVAEQMQPPPPPPPQQQQQQQQQQEGPSQSIVVASEHQQQHQHQYQQETEGGAGEHSLRDL